MDFKRYLTLVLVAAAVLAFSGCFSARPIGAPAGGEPSILGAIKVTSGPLGSLSLEPGSCTSGDRQQFLGADFEDARAGVAVRLVVDPLVGPAIRVFRTATPFDDAIVFHRADCSVFHFSLESTGWRINEVEDYRVSLELECASTEGDIIQGNVSSTHCH
jgi:hypothetical protein